VRASRLTHIDGEELHTYYHQRRLESMGLAKGCDLDVAFKNRMIGGEPKQDSKSAKSVHHNLAVFNLCVIILTYE
jgi:hypothetical protein